ncbi:MAG TPA: hypothetical protein VGL53_18735 [Bryobacteraceae bacterium]|jgi:hypothetical protein
MTRWALAAIFVLVLASRLAHLRIVWVEEAYPAAAAIEVLDSGKVLYRDVWFDKPAGTAYLYCLWGARTGIALRLADTAFLFSCCLLLFQLGRQLWSDREGVIAAALLAVYLTFGIPAAVMAIAPDLALVLPHIAAMYFAFLKRPVWAGVCAGIGFWFNTKALFVLASCVLFLSPLEWIWLGCGFAAATAVQFGVLISQGAFGAYVDQVWRWGAMYARHPFVEDPVLYGLKQTLNWCGFQSAAVLGTILYFFKGDRRWRFAGWIALSLIPVVLGLRFFPRYYFQLLPVIALLAARGFTMQKSRPVMQWLLLALVLIPVARFGPRYVMLTTDLIAGRQPVWSDLALAQDSEHVASALKGRSGSLFVWGYRPDIYVLTRMPAATPFLDSQPLSGVIADRHLKSEDVSAPEWAERFRGTVERARPDYIVDGLGPLNPKLKIPESYIASYAVIATTGGSVVYQRNP